MRKRNAKRKARGFTLIELMVSLLAGLFVALAVVALSKEATLTFHEEGRTAAAEMSLRTAVERLRYDLSRGGFMSSANIQKDPLIAHKPGDPNLPDNTSYPGLANLASVRLYYQGSAGALSTLNGLNTLAPDAIDIAGNFTSTDAFPVRMFETGGACAGQRLWLMMDSPSMWRVRALPDPDVALRTIFQPVAGQFLVRVEDDTGHTQYLPTCGSGVATAGINGVGLAATAWVDIANDTVKGFKILTAQETGTNGGATGLGVGRLTVNPVQIVRWQLEAIDTAQARFVAYADLASPAQADGGTTDKFELTRTFVDAAGQMTNATEIVAEYGVDLKFAFSSDLAAPATQNRSLTVYGLSDARNADVGAAVTTANGTQAPQRIRSVRFRLSTRSATPDRDAPLVAASANPQQGPYPLRYCVVTGGCTNGAPGWARVRTVTSEVSLPNTTKTFF